MSSLLDQQRTLRAQLLGTQLLPSLPLRIYRQTCIATLTQALRLIFPAVRRLVGEPFFDAVAFAFVEQSLPRQACLNSYGVGFDDFLQHYPAASSLSYLPDVARLELAINRALHAPDCAGLELTALMQLSEPQQSELRLWPHPAVTLLSLQFPVDQIWRAVLDQDDAALAAIDLDSGPLYLLVERDDDGVQVRRMTQRHWQFSVDLAAGQPLQQCLQQADEHTATVLADHLARGRFIRFELRPRGAESDSGESA